MFVARISSHVMYTYNVFSKAGTCTQSLQDLGQSSFGHVTCGVCGMVYTGGLDDDVREHAKFHHTGVTFNVRLFVGW